MMPWRISDRCDPAVRPLADRHYNRQSIGADNFAPPGRTLVLKTGDPVRAFWITSWPFAEFTKHAWAGAWICSAFRNEGAGLSLRSKKTPGYCYTLAGFRPCGRTKGGLYALQLLPDEMPAPLAALGAQSTLFGATPREQAT